MLVLALLLLAAPVLADPQPPQPLQPLQPLQVGELFSSRGLDALSDGYDNEEVVVEAIDPEMTSDTKHNVKSPMRRPHPALFTKQQLSQEVQLRAPPADSTGIDERNSFLEWLLGIAGITTTTPAPVLHPPANCETCVCGQTNKKIRIVGGQETQINEYPWMALLMYNGQFYCGGSLLNDRYVLTAAHCVSGFKIEKMSVRLLEHNRETADETQTITRKVARVVRHARFSNTNYNNDIALIRLDEVVTISGPLRPVCMPTPGKSFTHYQGIVTGWGATSENGAVSTSLQEVTLPIMSNAECRMTAYGEKRITDNMLCAGFPEGMKDSCQGDSGGPLHIINSTTNFHQVVGIVSWGEGCAQADHPGVYTRVNRYTTWIKSNTADACFCG